MINRVSLLLAFLVAPLTFADAAKDAVTKPLKTVVNSVRQSKDLLALKNFGGDEQGKLLLADDWAKGTEAQRKEFVQLFHTLFGKIAFPKMRKSFENLDTILYDDPEVKSDEAHISSVILINHPLKKQELKVKYVMKKAGAGWQVIDVSVLGDSMLKGIRDDQVAPLVKEGGWDGLLKAMRDKAKELEAQPLK